MSRDKPPHSYVTMIAMAILNTPDHRATLAQINRFLQENFEFFRSQYRGWRNSVRHNLSLNPCFVKILKDPSRPWAKDNYWTIRCTGDFSFQDGLFRRVKRQVGGCEKNKPSLKLAKVEEKSLGKFVSSFTIDSLLSRSPSETKAIAGEYLHQEFIENRSIGNTSVLSNPPGYMYRSCFVPPPPMFDYRSQYQFGPPHLSPPQVPLPFHYTSERRLYPHNVF